MKKFIVLLLVVFSVSAFAQEQTLISGEIESGGFGGPVLKMTNINGENAVMIGGRGGWIINHSFILGGAGYGVVSDVKAKVTDGIYQYIEMGYGGLDLEYIASSNDLVHLSIGVLVGGGGIGYKLNEMDGFNSSNDKNAFFVLEPSVSANLNVTTYFRIAAGASYRYVSGLKSALSTNGDLSGPSANLTLKFGRF
ncbi:MAG: hypothetical protein EHM64_14620 [Ignavibacteriae bacterium]|nr:MAG: hypothetical protein EHM64_14620 [Ignavibacteriota bacterium]